MELKDGDRITYEKKEYMYKENQISTDKKIVLFNKPVGYVVSKSDPHNTTIFEILPREFLQNFWYIGRLDKDSHGLLLLTNDSHLVHQYEHPSHDITKEYYVRLDNALSSKDLQECLKGVVSDDDLLRAVEIKALDGSNMYLSITLSEGKNRHIRRMFSALGYTVIDLQRVRFGEYRLGNIESGKFTTKNI